MKKCITNLLFFTLNILLVLSLLCCGDDSSNTYGGTVINEGEEESLDKTEELTEDSIEKSVETEEVESWTPKLVCEKINDKVDSIEEENGFYAFALNMLVILSMYTDTCPILYEEENLKEEGTYTLILDYGDGCNLIDGTLVSGSIEVYITNYIETETSLSADFLVKFVNITINGKESINGEILGDVQVEFNGPDKAVGEFSLKLNNIKVEDEYTISGGITGNFEITSFNANISITLKNVSDGKKIYNGTVESVSKLALSGNIETNIKINIDSTLGKVIIELIVETNPDTTYSTINTAKSGKIGPYTVKVNNVTYNPEICDIYFSDGEIIVEQSSNQATISFDESCDGTFYITVGEETDICLIEW